MKLSVFMGAGGSAKRHGQGTPLDDRPTYVSLGSDGIGYIATVGSNREEAAVITQSLTDDVEFSWSEFPGR